MPSAVSDCPVCGQPGRWGFDDDWCHEETHAALGCPREGWHPSEGEVKAKRTFPLEIAVFCDRCGTEVRHDYMVHDLMTREQRLDVAREHLTRNEGWRCGPDGDFCPRHSDTAAEATLEGLSGRRDEHDHADLRLVRRDPSRKPEYRLVPGPAVLLHGHVPPGVR